MNESGPITEWRLEVRRTSHNIVLPVRRGARSSCDSQGSQEDHTPITLLMYSSYTTSPPRCRQEDITYQVNQTFALRHAPMVTTSAQTCLAANQIIVHNLLSGRGNCIAILPCRPVFSKDPVSMPCSESPINSVITASPCYYYFSWTPINSQLIHQNQNLIIPPLLHWSTALVPS